MRHEVAAAKLAGTGNTPKSFWLHFRDWCQASQSFVFGTETRMNALRIVTILLTLAAGYSCGAHASEDRVLKEYTPDFGCYDPGGKIVQSAAKTKGTKKYSEHEEEEIYRDLRCDTDGYALKVPNGTYKVEMKFCEIEHAVVGRRVFGIKVQGEQLKERLDIFAAVGKNTACEVRSPEVKVTDGVLRIQFVRIVGSPCIAALSVGGNIAGDENAVRRVFYQHINCGGGSFRGYYADFGCGGEPNQAVQRTGARRSIQETHRKSGAVGPRR